MLVGAAIGVATLNAQSLSDYRTKLSLFERIDGVDMVDYVNADIIEDSSSVAAFEALKIQELDPKTGEPKEAYVDGYRIGVFFDNGASARAKAEGVMDVCAKRLKDIPASMSYDNPYFKVCVGYCVTLEEAVMLLHRVQRVFSSAYLMRERIYPQDLVTARNAELIAMGLEPDVDPTDEPDSLDEFDLLIDSLLSAYAN